MRSANDDVDVANHGQRANPSLLARCMSVAGYTPALCFSVELELDGGVAWAWGVVTVGR